MDNTKPSSFLLGFQRKLDRVDAKKNQVYETVDHESEDCFVQAFKKVSYNKKKYSTSYVSSFPFSGHSTILDDGSEIQPAIESELPNQEALIQDIE